MYKILALFTGSAITLLVLSNAIMSASVGNPLAIVLNHVIGLFCAVILLVSTATKPKSLKNINIVYLLSGVTGFFTVLFANISFMELGATITLMIMMTGQIIASSTIDHFGILGMEKYPFSKYKLLGIFLMLLGVSLIILG